MTQRDVPPEHVTSTRKTNVRKPRFAQSPALMGGFTRQKERGSQGVPCTGVDRPWLVSSIIAGVATLITALVLAGCGDDEQGGGGNGPLDLTVGGILPLSGSYSYLAESGEKSSDLAVEQIRKAIDQAGVDHEIQMIIEDDQSEPQSAVSAARKALAEGATCFVGTWSTATSIPVAESVTIPNEIVQISPSSTSNETTAVEDDGYLNRTILPNSLQAPALADLVEQELGGSRGIVLNVGARNDSFGTDFAETFRAEWTERGGEIGQEVSYDPELSSYESEASEIVEGDPDAWVIMDFPETFSKVGPALARTGAWDPKRTFVPEGLYSTSLEELLDSNVITGIRGTNPGSPDDADAATAFARLYESSPGTKQRETTDAQTFDAGVLCYLAAVAAGSVEGSDLVDELQAVSAPPGEEFTFEQLPEAIEALASGEDIDYQGASGPIDLDDNGDPTAGVYDVFTYDDAGNLSVYDEISVD